MQLVSSGEPPTGHQEVAMIVIFTEEETAIQRSEVTCNITREGIRIYICLSEPKVLLFLLNSP